MDDECRICKRKMRLVEQRYVGYRKECPSGHYIVDCNAGCCHWYVFGRDFFAHPGHTHEEWKLIERQALQAAERWQNFLVIKPPPTPSWIQEGF